MGMYFLLYLILYITTNLVIVVSSDVKFRDDISLSALTSFLIALNSNISKYLSVPRFITVPFTPNCPTQVFTQSKLSVSIENQQGFLNFSFISLEHSEFAIKSPVLLHKKYPSPYKLDLSFSPVFVGIHTAYLIVRTQDGLLIYYLIGISEENKYQFEPLSLKFEDYIYGKIKVANKENSLILKIDKSDLKWEVEYFGDSFSINELGEKEINIFKLNISKGLKVFGKIWIDINKEEVFMPVSQFRSHHPVECGEEIDLGILVMKDSVYNFEIRCQKNTDFMLNIKEVITNRTDIWFNLKEINQNSDFFSLGILFIKTRQSGRHTGEIVFDCENESFILRYKFLSVFDIVETDKDKLYFTNIFETNREICIKNHLNHDIWVRQCSTSSSLFIINQCINFIGSNDSSCVKIQSRPVIIGGYSLFIDSNIGNLVIPLYSIEPILHFYVDDSQIFGPIDLGNILANTQIEKRVIIVNKNPVKIQVYSIQAIPNVLTNYIPSTLSQNSFEFLLKIKSNVSIDGPLTISTSIGIFYLSVYANTLHGSVKIEPVVFTSLYPKERREENIVLINQYPVSIKVKDLQISGENIETSFDPIEVPAYSNRTIGKAIGSVKLNEKSGIDFKKTFSIGDIKRSFAIKNFEPLEMKYEIKVLTDLAGEVKGNLKMHIRKPGLIVKQQNKGGFCLLNSFCVINFLIKNPLDVLIRTQIIVVPDNFYKTLGKYDCSTKKKSEALDDEFENIQHDPGSSCDEAFINDKEELKHAFLASELRPNFANSPQPKSFMSKLYNVLMYSILTTFSQDTSSQKQEEQIKPFQSLYLNDNQVFSVPPYSSRVIGPVIFYPQNSGTETLPLLIKNNYTVLEYSEVVMNVSNRKLAITKKSNYNFNEKFYTLQRSLNKKDFQKIPFDVSPEEISRFLASPNVIYSPIVFKTYDLQNIGNVDVEVLGIYINDRACASRGFEIKNCGRNFVLKPGETFVIEVSYRLLESYSNDYSKLVILTEDQEYSYTIETYIIESIGISTFLYILADFYYIICLSFVLTISIITIKQALKVKISAFDVRTSKELKNSSIQKYFCKDYSHYIMLNKNEEHVAAPPPEIKETFVEPVIIPVKKRRENTKTSKTLTKNVVQASELGKKTARVLPECIANNKYLIDKPKKNRIVSSKSLVEEKGKEDESDDDFLLDAAYKNSQFFRPYIIQESCSLAELEKDSDPTM